jgi:hypothetical protein
MSFTKFGKWAGVIAASLPVGWDKGHTKIRGDVPHLKNSKSVLKLYEWKFQSSKLCLLYCSILENRLNFNLQKKIKNYEQSSSRLCTTQKDRQTDRLFVPLLMVVR